MPLQHQEGLLTMMERGEFTSTKVRNTKTVKANIVIFATSNSTERLSKPLLSRFTVFEIPVCKTGSRDIRDVLKIAKLCNPADGEEDISRLILIYQKYRKTGQEYN